MSRWKKSVAVSAATLTLLAASTVASAVEGLAGPLFGLDAAPNGDVLVADASSGITVIRDDAVRSTIEAPGATGVSAIGSKSMWVSRGAGANPEADTGQALLRVSNGRTRTIANLFAFEAAEDPDGAGADSNPYDVAALGGGAALVVDAGGNTLLRVDRDGTVELVATFPEEQLSTDNLNSICSPGPELPPCPFPAREILGQAVPTSVAIGPDGDYYVGELKGFPAPVAQSGVWRIDAEATNVNCGVDPECEKVLDGFTSIVDLDFGPDGTLYVSELDENSWAAVEIYPDEQVGGTANACDLTTRSCVELATGVPQHTAVTVDKKGAVYATVNGLVPNGGSVIQID